ncbi:hypothetical protein ACHQM5_000322 [Ranunculus cassubicifolius]
MIFRPWSLITGPPAIVGSIVATVAVTDRLFLHDLLFGKEDHVVKTSPSLKELRQERRNQLVENIQSIQTDNRKDVKGMQTNNHLHSAMADHLRMKEKTVKVTPVMEERVQVTPEVVEIIPEKEETARVIPEKKETVDVTQEKEETVEFLPEIVKVIPEKEEIVQVTPEVVEVIPEKKETVEVIPEKQLSDKTTLPEHLTSNTIPPLQDQPPEEKEIVQVPPKEQSSDKITEKKPTAVIDLVNSSKTTISTGQNLDKVIDKKKPSDPAEDSLSYWQEHPVKKDNDLPEDSLSYWKDQPVKKEKTLAVNDLPEDSILYWKDK